MSYKKLVRDKIPESAYNEGIYNETFNDRFRKIKPGMNAYAAILQQHSNILLPALPGVNKDLNIQKKNKEDSK